MNLSDDDFTLLGLPQQFRLNRAELDARYRALQAEVHPDRFASAGPGSQRVAMQWSVRVNEAYQRLRQPVSRGAYLCELRGAPVQAERNTAMPAEFLVQQMQWRERLADADDLEAVEALDDEVAASERALEQELMHCLDVQSDPPAAVARVRALMFVAKFRADLGRRIDELAP